MRSPNFGSSLGSAVLGILYALRTQRNMKIHLLASILVVAAGMFFRLDKLEWIAIILTVSAVWAAEIVNTSLEEIVDLVSPEYDIRAGNAKNLGAGAVLVTAIASLAVGITVFGPRIIHLLGGLWQ